MLVESNYLWYTQREYVMVLACAKLVEGNLGSCGSSFAT